MSWQSFWIIFAITVGCNLLWSADADAGSFRPADGGEHYKGAVLYSNGGLCGPGHERPVQPRGAIPRAVAIFAARRGGDSRTADGPLDQVSWRVYSGGSWRILAFDTSIKMQVDRQRTANFEENGRKEYAERDSTYSFFCRVWPGIAVKGRFIGEMEDERCPIGGRNPFVGSAVFSPARRVRLSEKADRPRRFG